MQTSQTVNAHQLPAGVNWLFGFQALNAVNFTIAMGAPMILLIRFLGGSELHVGAVTAIPPLLAVLQLVSTRIIERLGYRGSMMIGWSGRSLLLIFIAPLPLVAHKYSPELLLGVLFAAYLGFNTIRGLTSAAWFPWLTTLIPDSLRGKFVGLEQRVINVAAFLTLILGGLFLKGEEAAPWRFTAIFIFATLAGVASAWFLSRAPDRPIAATNRKNNAGSLAHVWEVARASWKDHNFRWTLTYLLLFNFLVFPSQGFLILYIKENLAYPSGDTLKLQALNTLGVLISAVFWGGIADRWGSKPLLKVAILGILAQYCLWLLFSAGFIPPYWPLVFLLQMAWGIFISAHVVAAIKMMLGCCPRRDLTAEMAVIQVSLAMCNGVAPLLIGGFLRAIRPESLENLTVISVGFALIFGIGMLGCAAALVLIARLPEPSAGSSRKLLAYLIIEWPMRFFMPNKRSD